MIPIEHTRKVWLTRCHGGRYLITALKPIIAPIKGTGGVLDAFEQVGEPLCIKHLCAPGVRSILGQDLPELVPTKIFYGAAIIPNNET